MKTLRLPLVWALAAAAALSACKKDKDPEPSKTDLLTDSDWILSAHTVSPAMEMNGQLTTDLFPHVRPCDRDDVLQFDRPNAYFLDEGASKCGSGPQSSPGTWAFTDNETVLRTQLNGKDANTYNLLELKNGTLRLRGEQVGDDGVTYTHTFTLVKR
ncbi:hypothetical protein [Hymenobacter sp. B81]|uniref:hypothetical protein n=1 Tax=Hymenobacter sp. B81 TaxID=3344878 RepID=UPI0037DCAA92